MLVLVLVVDIAHCEGAATAGAEHVHGGDAARLGSARADRLQKRRQRGVAFSRSIRRRLAIDPQPPAARFHTALILHAEARNAENRSQTTSRQRAHRAVKALQTPTRCASGRRGRADADPLTSDVLFADVAVHRSGLTVAPLVAVARNPREGSRLDEVARTLRRLPRRVSRLLPGEG